MGKYDKIFGFIQGIKDEEFEILLKLAFTLNGFKVEKIRRKILVTNDFLFNLTRTKKRFFRGEKKFVYVAYIDRKQHEYSNEWVSDFKLRANTYDTYLSTIEKIYIMNMNKIQKIKLRKDLKKNISFKTGNNFFSFLFTPLPENVSFLESLYGDENQIWDEKTQEQQKDFCEKINVDYIRYNRLWKYRIDQQSILIFSLQNAHQKTDSDSDLKKYYDILEVNESASLTEIKTSYRVLLNFYHPDKFYAKSIKQQEYADNKTKKITEAYKELKKASKVD